MATDVPGIAGAAARQAGAPAQKPERPDTSHPAPDAAAPGGAPPVRSADAVNLQMQVLGEKVREAPVVDEARVQAVKEALASGELKIDPQRIAEKLIDFEIKLP